MSDSITLSVNSYSKGDAGASAYEVAVANGFEGTETEWLNSLIGAKGDKGDKGDTGDTGPQGATGATGATGNGVSSVNLISTVGLVNTYRMTFTNGNYVDIAITDGAKGDKGDTGATGAKGDKGDTGDTGYPTDAQVSTAVNTWLGDNVAQETGYVLDSSLTMSNAAAPADLVGDLKSHLTESDEKTFAIKTVGKTSTISTTAGTSITSSTVAVDLHVPSGTTFYALVTDPNSVISGGISLYSADSTGTATKIGALTEGVQGTFTANSDIASFRLYISGSSLATGSFTLYVHYNIESYDSLETKVDNYHAYPISSIASANIFTGWTLGRLRITDGLFIEASDRLVSNFIPVTGGTDYIVQDPDAISTQARNAQFVYEYDSDYSFIKSTTLTTSETLTTNSSTAYIRLLSQSTGTNSYSVGDYEDFETAVYASDEYIAYASPNKTASNIGTDNTVYPMASAQDPDNLFHGGAFLCSGLSYTTGKVTASGSTIMVTPYFAATGTIYWRMFEGKTGDVQYIFEFNSNYNFIKRTTVSDYYGSITLDNSTAYIRIRSQTNGVNNYAVPTATWFDEHLVVSSTRIDRYQNYLPVVSQANVSKDFYDSAVSFVGIEDYKSDIDTYTKGILESGYDVVIPFVTDVHSEFAEAYDIHNYIAGSGIADVAFNLGDNIPNYYTTRQEAVDVLESVFHEEFMQPRKCEVFCLFGNHDYNPYNSNGSSYTIGQKLFYSLCQARTKKGYAGVGKNYGYLDIDAAKVRLIWLDSADIFDSSTGEALTTGNNTMIQQTQFTWFCNTALDFSDISDRSDWSVITVSHDRLSSLTDGFATVIAAFMGGTSASGTAYCSGRTDDPIELAYDVDYSTQGAIKYICHVNGHYHEDSLTALGSTGRYQISIAADNVTAYYYDDDNTKTAYTRTPGTIEEHCIDTLCLDKTNSQIVMKRLGIGSDRTISYS